MRKYQKPTIFFVPTSKDLIEKVLDVRTEKEQDEIVREIRAIREKMREKEERER